MVVGGRWLRRCVLALACTMAMVGTAPAAAGAVPPPPEQAPAAPEGDTAPAGEEPAAEEEAPDDDAPDDELVEERTATTKTFTTDEPGVYRTEVYGQPVHFAAADGDWEEIDPALVPVGDGFGSEGTGAPVEVAPEGGSTDVTVDLGDGASVGFELGSADVAGAAEDTVTVADVAGGVDVELEVVPAGVKETLVLADAGAPRRYVFPLDLQGVEAAVAPGGAVELTDADGELVGRIPAGWMADATVHPVTGEPATSMGVTYTLVDGPDGPSLQVDLDDAWLDDPARAYPVRVDPSVLQATADVDDTYVMAFAPGDRSALLELQVGNNGFLGTRSFAHFPALSTVASKRIHHAHLKLFQTGGGGCTPTPMDVYPVTASWAGSTTTTYGGPATAATPVATITSAAGATGCEAGAWATADVSGIVSSWAAGTVANHGLALRARDEFDATQFKRFGSGDSWTPPHIQVLWSEPVANGPSAPTAVAPTGAVGTLTPTLSALYADPQGRDGVVHFLVLDGAGNAFAGGSGHVVASGKRSAWRMPPGTLAAGTTYTVKTFATTVTDVSSPNGTPVTFTPGSTDCYATGCEYDPATLTVPGNPALEQALTECEGEPATLGFGWQSGSPSGLTYRGTEGRDVVVVTSGPVAFDGLGEDDLVCLPVTGFPNGTNPLGTVNAGDGDDRAVASGGRRLRFRGGEGQDEAVGGTGVDDLAGEAGSDTLEGGAAADTIGGGDGQDTLTGGDGNDVIDGGAGGDGIDAGVGTDEVLGGPGMDEIDGGSGPDEIDAGVDGDIVRAGPGIDVVIGGDGDDRLEGGTGTDDLSGGAGDDVLIGDPDVDDCDGGTGGEVDGDTAFTCETVAAVEHQDIRIVSPSNGETLFAEAAIVVEHPDGPDPVTVRVSTGSTVLEELEDGVDGAFLDLGDLTAGPLTLEVELLDDTSTVIGSAEVDVTLELPTIDDLAVELADRYEQDEISADEYLVSGTVATASSPSGGGTEDFLGHYVAAIPGASWDARQAIEELHRGAAVPGEAGPPSAPLQARGDAVCDMRTETWAIGLIFWRDFCVYKLQPEVFAQDLPYDPAELFDVIFWMEPTLDRTDESPEDGTPDVLVDRARLLWKAQRTFQARGFSLPEVHRPNDGNVAMNLFMMNAPEAGPGLEEVYDVAYSSPFQEWTSDEFSEDGLLPLGHPIRFDASALDTNPEAMDDLLTHELFHTFEWNNISWLWDVEEAANSKQLEIVSFYESAANWATQEYSVARNEDWGFQADRARDHWLSDPKRTFLSGAGGNIIIDDGAYAWFPALEWLDEHGAESRGDPSESNLLLDRAFARFNHARFGVDPVDLIEDQIDEGQFGNRGQGDGKGLARAWPRMWAALYIMDEGDPNGEFDEEGYRWAQFWGSETTRWRDVFDVADEPTDDDEVGEARPARVAEPEALGRDEQTHTGDPFTLGPGGAGFQDYVLPEGTEGEVELEIEPLDRDDRFEGVAIVWTDDGAPNVCTGEDGKPMVLVSDGDQEEDGSIEFDVPYRADCPYVSLGAVHVDANSEHSDDFELSATAVEVEDIAPVNIDEPEIVKGEWYGRPVLQIASTGTWSPEPGSFTYRWLQCNSGGINCTPIFFEFSDCFPSRYSLIGSTVKLELTAIGVGGISEPVTSNSLSITSADFAGLADPDGPSVFELPGGPTTSARRTMVSRDENGVQEPYGAITSVLSGNGRLAYGSAFPDGLWNVETARRVGGPDASSTADLSHTGRYMAAGVYNGSGYGIALQDLACGGYRRIAVDPATGEKPEEWHIADYPTITSDGRYVVFAMEDEGGLVGHPRPDPQSNVFRFDAVTGELVLVSRVGTLPPPIGDSGTPSISDDGRWVAFWTSAPALGASAATGGDQAVVVDMNSFTTTVVSTGIPRRHEGTHIEGGVAGSSAGEGPITISNDGAYVTFMATGSFIHPDNPNDDRFENRTYRVSRSGSGLTLLNADPHIRGARQAQMSGDGAWVVFTSYDPMVAADTNGECDTYLTQVGSGTYTLVSQADDGTIGDGMGCSYAAPPSVSDDGRYVSFTTSSTNMPGDTNDTQDDIWVYDRLHP